MKPVALVVKAIKDASLKSDIVLDLFGGSGTILIACEQTERLSCLMELDEKYGDVIIERYKSFKESEKDIMLLREGKEYTYQEIFNT